LGEEKKVSGTEKGPPVVVETNIIIRERKKKKKRRFKRGRNFTGFAFRGEEGKKKEGSLRVKKAANPQKLKHLKKKTGKECENRKTSCGPFEELGVLGREATRKGKRGGGEGCGVSSHGRKEEPLMVLSSTGEINPSGGEVWEIESPRAD